MIWFLLQPTDPLQHSQGITGSRQYLIKKPQASTPILPGREGWIIETYIKIRKSFLKKRLTCLKICIHKLKKKGKFQTLKDNVKKWPTDSNLGWTTSKLSATQQQFKSKSTDKMLLITHLRINLLSRQFVSILENVIILIYDGSQLWSCYYLTIWQLSAKEKWIRKYVRKIHLWYKTCQILL